MLSNINAIAKCSGTKSPLSSGTQFKGPCAFAVLVCIGVTCPNVHAQDLEIGGIPKWVNDRPYESLQIEMPKESNGSVEWLLHDEQILYQPNSMSSYVHSATRATSIYGVNRVSNFALPFFETTDSIKLHYVKVHREGQILDRTESSQIRYSRQDSAVPDDMDQLLTVAMVLVSGVKAGDVVEYAATMVRRNAMYDGIYSAAFGYGDINIGDAYRRVVVPRGTVMQFEITNDHPAAEFARAGRYDEYVFRIGAVTEVELEDDVPIWYSQYPTASFSNLDHWSTVAEWGLERFKQPKAVPDEIVEQAHALIEDDDTNVQKLHAALNFVRADVRYVGPGIGRNGHRPYAPDVVLERLYGDCKDKTVLLQSLLKAMNIDAWPALVSTTRRRAIASSPPTPLVFDHVILNVHLDGEEYWVDPTTLPIDDIETSLAPAHAFEKALVLRADTDGLRDIEGPDHNSSPDHYLYRTNIDLTKESWGDVVAEVAWEFRGDIAHSLKRMGTQMRPEEFADYILENEVEGLSDSEAVVPPALVHSYEQGHVEIAATYKINGLVQFADASAPDFIVSYPYRHILEYVEEPHEFDSRVTPYALPYPFFVTESVSMKLGSMFFQSSVNATEVNGEFFEYAVRPHWDGESYHVEYSLRMLRDHVMPDQFESFRRDLERVRNTLQYSVSGLRSGWPVVILDDSVSGSSRSLADAINEFNRYELAWSAPEGEIPELTLDEIRVAIDSWDTTERYATDQIQTLFRNALVTQQLHNDFSLQALPSLTDSDDSDQAWHIDLCLFLPNYATYCVPVRR